MGYMATGGDYQEMVELGRSTGYLTKAFQLREHASEPEKLRITARYYLFVTGELNKAAQTYEQEIQSYPRNYRPYVGLVPCTWRKGNGRRHARRKCKVSASNPIM